MKVFDVVISTAILGIVLSPSRGEIDDLGVETTTATTTTTEPALFPTGVSIENITNNPLDNGMVIKDITSDNDVYNTNIVETTSLPPLPSSLGPVVFPINHRNYTSLQYAVDGFRPPLNHRNKYQDPYKIYNKQKHFNNMKPLKFEENSMKTLFIPSNYGKKKPGDSRVEQTQFVMKPFPYAFEYSQDWEENGGRDSHDEPFNSNHQENGNSYTYYPQGFHDQKGDFLQHDSHWNHDVAKDTGYKSSWKKLAQIVTALVPFGLLLATLTPSVFTIDSTSNVPAKLRSEDVAKEKFTVEDVLKLLRENGVDSRSFSKCEDRALCNLARKGGGPSANSIERGFWFLAHRTPKDVAQKAGMDQLFEAIRAGKCDLFECESREKSEGRGTIKRKVVRKRKLVSGISDRNLTRN